MPSGGQSALPESPLQAATTDAMTLLMSQPFHVLLISRNFEGDAAGLKLAREACALHARVKFVMLLETSEGKSVVQAFRAGCRFFCHVQSPKEWSKCLDCVHRGRIWATSQELTSSWRLCANPGLSG